jgi:phage shock protein E
MRTAGAGRTNLAFRSLTPHPCAVDAIWLPLLVAGAFLALLTWFRRGGQLKADQAVALLRDGVRIVDVRTPAEFNAAHLTGAVNLPLNHLAEQAPEILPSKDEVVLLHCLSGGRSLIARVLLRRRGYSRVHNLGSLARARTLLSRSGR